MYYKTTGCWKRVARSEAFNSLTLIVDCVDTDINTSEALIHALPVFIVVENMFCLYFFMEWPSASCRLSESATGSVMDGSSLTAASCSGWS